MIELKDYQETAVNELKEQNKCVICGWEIE